MNIPFNKPFLTGQELSYIQDAHDRGQLAGDGHYTKLCHDWLEEYIPGSKALLTHSCTAALEIAALLLDIKSGDEIIMPSYTFVSTANAFVLRGAIPVFVDISPDTLNINPNLIASAITSRTKAIVVVHYAGVSCDLNPILELAYQHNLFLVEDAAQAILASHCSQPLGSIGDVSCFSFHETKNVICGEGGAIVINNPSLKERAEIIREKGTDRSKFFRGEVDKYSWVDIGSSYLPGELNAAFLLAQLQSASSITNARLAIWENYNKTLKDNLRSFDVTLPVIPDYATHNAHMFYLKFDESPKRDLFIKLMRERGIQTVFHYLPLHSSVAGLNYSRCQGNLVVTEDVSSCIVRLPLFIGLKQDIVVESIVKVMGQLFA